MFGKNLSENFEVAKSFPSRQKKLKRCKSVRMHRPPSDCLFRFETKWLKSTIRWQQKLKVVDRRDKLEGVQSYSSPLKIISFLGYLALESKNVKMISYIFLRPIPVKQFTTGSLCQLINNSKNWYPWFKFVYSIFLLFIPQENSNISSNVRERKLILIWNDGYSGKFISHKIV